MVGLNGLSMKHLLPKIRWVGRRGEGGEAGCGGGKGGGGQ